MPSGGGCIVPPITSSALADRVDEGLAVDRQHQGAADVGIVERRHGAVDQDVEIEVHRRRLADRLRRVLGDQLAVRRRHFPAEGEIKSAGDEAQDGGRGIADNVEVDAVEIGLVLFPVVGIAHQPDVLELAELRELERSGADRPRPHLRRRDVAGIDRHQPGGQHGKDRRLRVGEVEGDLVVAASAHEVDVGEPRFARIAPQLLRCPVEQQIEGADHVARGERLAVMPLHAVLQLEGEFGLLRIVGPRLGEGRARSSGGRSALPAGRTSPGC
jgi:hypothetical protein